VAFIAVADTGAAVSLLAGLRARLPGISAAELCFPAGLELTARKLGVTIPLEGAGGAYVLAEVAGEEDPVDALLAALEESDLVLDATVAASAADRARLWALREGHTEAISAAGVPVKLDVSVPADRLAELVARLPDVVAAAEPAAEVVVFGHLAEANLHVNVLRAGDSAEAVTGAVLSLVAGLAGSVSSEHGVGRAKAPWLGLSRSPAEIEVMRSVKAAFDPAGLLNPGVLFPAGPPAG
jgi:FAD/FMN-containing dehydrogenase